MDDALRALKKSGINVSSVSQKTRELIFDLQNYRILSCKPIDVPKYVEMGTADCGIVGSDCITESMCDVYEPISLKFALVGLSDVIVDITESGETIRKNNLKIIDTVMDITAKVIFNKTSVRTKQKTLENFAKIIKK